MYRSAALLVLFLAGVSVAAEVAPGEDAALDAFFREHLEAGFQMRPSMATALGDHRFDDRLDDVSTGARLRWAKHTREALDALPWRVSFGKLSRAGQIDYEILEHHLRRSLWLTEQFKPFVTDPRSYNGLVSGTVFSLLTQSTLPLDKNAANAVARIRQIPKVIAAAQESLVNPPRVYVETAIQQNRGAIRFYEAGVFELAGQTKHQAELKAAAAELVPVLQG